MDIFQRVSAAAEELVFAEEESPVLALFDRDIFRTAPANLPSRLDQAGLLRQLSRFAVVQDQEINSRKEGIEIGPSRFDPKVHCVRDDEPRTLHLIEHVRLKSRCNVCQQHEIGGAI